VTTEIND